MQFARACIVSGVCLVFLTLVHPFCVSAETVKTYVKQYSIFTFDHEDYLCEPYQVKKNDWLYKIFRKKGEISARDFPRFLKIFRQLNPKLSNIDAIEPGHQILIPLKEVSRKTYTPKAENLVEVPVLEFSSSFQEEQLTSFIHPQIIQPGDTVSQLLDRAFRPNGGAVSDIGKKVFYQLNPGIKNIDKVYLGSRVIIPDPAIMIQPWFQDFLLTDPISSHLLQESSGSRQPAALPTLPDLPPEDLMKLKRYAQLIQGALQHQGEMVFPGKGNQPAQVLNLSKTPVLTRKNGQKHLILPPKTPGAKISGDLLKGIRAYWKELQVQELNKALAETSSFFSKPLSLDEVPDDPQAFLNKALSAAGFTVQSPSPVPVKIGTITMDITLARIVHPERPDILINPGTVFGLALETLERNGVKVFTFSSETTGTEILLGLFSRMGYTQWKNPAVNVGGRVRILNGVYAERQQEKWFFTRSVFSDKETAFLEAEGINLIQL